MAISKAELRAILTLQRQGRAALDEIEKRLFELKVTPVKVGPIIVAGDPKRTVEIARSVRDKYLALNWGDGIAYGLFGPATNEELQR